MRALGAALLLSACGGPKEVYAPTVKTARAAIRLTIRAQTVADLKPVPGTLTTRDMAEARARIAGDDDIAVILLDVVMESPDAGLALVHTIRETLGRSEVRIVLRTGQPGYAPEMKVIRE